MSALLTIGDVQFVLSSAAVASGIVEALEAAPQVTPFTDGTGTVTYVATAFPVPPPKATTLEGCRVAVIPPPTSPLAQAVLGEATTKQRRATRSTLDDAAGAIRAAKAKRKPCSLSAVN